jgi:DNA-directed RNA polymerase specialized sigma24 family protein
MLASVERLVWESAWRMSCAMNRVWDQDGIENAAAAARAAVWDLTRTWREDGGANFATYVFRAVRTAARRSLYQDKVVGMGDSWRRGKTLGAEVVVHRELPPRDFPAPFADTIKADRGEAPEDPGWLAEYVRGSRLLSAADRSLLIARLSGETLRSIGDPLGISREMVRQRFATAVRKIKSHLHPYNDPRS